MSIYRGGKILFSTIDLQKQLFGGDFLIIFPVSYSSPDSLPIPMILNKYPSVLNFGDGIGSGWFCPCLCFVYYYNTEPEMIIKCSWSRVILLSLTISKLLFGHRFKNIL